ncbi:MgtC/SapB family protein [Sinanaerobacter sp. ZZT-01]|uniref:MgtC/SapB family protein n=1 Tax=Sinanaerobacter sp. ZZT-01 TaxID=3111540 RepID=UPI002D770A8D|nr:MgtC/SapB family protein [Sinanaerobacter sp. ZZT-01]WRR94294.1 MgtC/SapB family protein [Sinanaerobacter sp. ZZT-01]
MQQLQVFYTIYLQDINLISVTIRLILSIFLGGMIGLERGSNKHQAGFRTHMLVCMGAALAMLTNQFIYETMSTASDPARLGAQVISGIGFLGVGTILVTGRHKIKGLTTAAGLWASACTGLAIGIGFYSGAIIAGILIFIVLAFLPSIELYFYKRSRMIDLYIETDSIKRVPPMLKFIRSLDVMIPETHLSRSETISEHTVGVHLSIKLAKHVDRDELLEEISNFEGIYLLEEI